MDVDLGEELSQVMKDCLDQTLRESMGHSLKGHPVSQSQMKLTWQKPGTLTSQLQYCRTDFYCLMHVGSVTLLCAYG